MPGSASTISEWRPCGPTPTIVPDWIVSGQSARNPSAVNIQSGFIVCKRASFFELYSVYIWRQR